MEYDIWYTSGDHKALDFIRSMNPINKRLDKKVLMTPHMMVQTCGWCSASEIERNCISVDRTPYCAPPIRDSNLTGREALRQGLTEYCVYKEYHEEKPQAWWDYMDGIQECERERYRSECSDKALKQAGIDLHRVDRCLAKEQEILRAEHELWQASGIVYNPAVVINNRVYRVNDEAKAEIGNPGREQRVQEHLRRVQRDPRCVLRRLRPR